MGEVSFCFTKRRLHFGSGLRGEAEVIFHFSKLLLHLERVIFRFRGGATLSFGTAFSFLNTATSYLAGTFSCSAGALSWHDAPFGESGGKL